jgi:hypothetical protein
VDSGWELFEGCGFEFERTCRDKQAIAYLGDGLDEARMMGVVVERVTENGDAARKRVFANERIWPNGAEEFIL